MGKEVCVGRSIHCWRYFSFALFFCESLLLMLTVIIVKSCDDEDETGGVNKDADVLVKEAKGSVCV